MSVAKLWKLRRVRADLKKGLAYLEEARRNIAFPGSSPLPMRLGEAIDTIETVRESVDRMIEERKP